MEQRISSRNAYGSDKKPKDLMRAIGKIDSNDWNVREIEKKIEQSKKTEVYGPKGREKVPKWSREQFQARQNKMSKPTRQDSAEEKFKEIDQTLKNLDKQLKEGNVLEVGKVASIAGQFVKRDDTSEEKNPPTIVPKSSTKVALAFKKQAASEKCHFCKQTVYLMEKLQTENLVMHRGCLKCHHCHTNLRLGAYAFDRDDPNGRFYCTQHFRLPAKAVRPVARKPGQRKTSAQQPQRSETVPAVDTVAKNAVPAHINSESGDEPRTPDKRGPVDNVARMDLLERGQTPERIEFENTDAMSDGEPSEEHIIDEHEWSGRNFLPESNNDSESDLSSSDESDSDSDSDMFEEANDSPLGAQTLQLASEWIGKQNYTDSDDSDDFYDSSEGMADDGKDDTEGEEFAKARELRREEVRLPPLPPNLPTDTETEVQSESESTSPDEVELNSATEISTDSEFDHDEMIRETPKIFIDDTHLRKPTKVQIKSTVISPSMGQKYNNASKVQQDKGGTYLAKYQTQQQQYQTPPPVIPQFKPLVQVDPSLLNSNRTPLQNPRPGDYLLNKTASTEGIASKKSLELKKRYLLGEPANGNKIQKSGSTSVLDSRIRSFQSNISECQKLLNPGNDISPSMKTFLDRTKLGGKSGNDLMRSATNNILNDLKVEITIQKASSTASTDNEKENVFVNSKNELNKCLEFSETVNNTLLDALNKKSTPTTPTNNKNIIATIDLVTPEKEKAAFDTSDSNKVIDLTGDSPVTVKPDLSLDVKQTIPDILGHIEKHADIQQSKSKDATPTHEKKQADDEISLIDNNMEKVDVPEKQESNYDNEIEDVQIEVPNIAWCTKTANLSSCSNSSCSSHSSSLEDIEHYILESTTSPETHNSCGNVAAAVANHQVPRLEVHDTSGTLMQIDSLMIIDGKYIGDPDDLKFIDVPEGIIIPEVPAVKTSEVEDDHEVDLEPVTATPEPAETTVIEAEKFDEKEQDIEPPPLPENGPPLPEKGPPKMKPSNLKFDTKNENKIESLKNLPLIVDATTRDYKKAVKPITLNLTNTQKTPETPTTPKGNLLQTPNSPSIDMDKTPTGDVMSRGSDSETEPTGTAQILTETELSDWTADDCISENFIDMEFDHRSNKSKLKGGGRKEKKRNTRCLPTTNEVLKEVANTAPVAEFEGILKSIDIDDIEFMDTGSDGSGTEPLSATNTALLRNRGYMEFVETAPKSIKATSKLPSQSGNLLSNTTFKPIQTKRDEKLGIDYIEQGAYIMHDDLNKTPVNEGARSIPSSQMTQSLTDSSTLNDIEDESTCALSSQMQLTSVDNTSKTTQQTTTEESEALTVVTSPFDSSSPQTQNSNNLKKDIITAIALEKGDSSTPSSSDRAPKTSQSTSCTNSATSSSKNTPPLQQSREPLIETGKSNDEISYEEYVRALQQKIVQISTTARGDSLEARKQRRKSSKGEAPIALTNPNQTVIESTTTATSTLTPTNLRLDKSDETKTQTIAANSTATVTESASASVSASGSATKDVTEVLSTIQHNKVPEIPTLTSKLEEITKERTKQKDLIHDLVMDKLQSKKQLNAEKRLHRSRQRTMVTSGTSGLSGGGGGYSSASSLSPTPKLAAANSTTDTNCTNQAHYHVCTAAAETLPSASDRATIQRLLNISSSFKENTPSSVTSPSYVATYGMEALSPTRANAYKQRPFSEHLEGDSLKSFEQRYKITKTPSFSYASTSTKMQPTSYSELSTPIPPLRQKRNGNGNDVMPTPNEINKDFILSSSISTENLRSEARARARLKSNSELGLSPEEKMQVLRKRLQAEYASASNVSKDPEPHKTTQSSYERRQFSHSIRENKMNTSKSVNDLAYLSQSQKTNFNTIGITNNNATAKSIDFTSDPNLLLSSSSQSQSQSQSAAAGVSSGLKPLKTKSGRRAKDPERRKSLIQSLSNFFHKGPQNKENKQQKDATATVSDGSSAQPDRPGTGGGSSSTSTSQTVSSGIDGVLSRFRISPKTKEKSRND